MTKLAYKSFAELESLCTCESDALDGEAPMCEACSVIGAIEAGIPRSVIAGDSKLTDHFSPDYIDHQRNIKRKEDV